MKKLYVVMILLFCWSFAACPVVKDELLQFEENPGMEITVTPEGLLQYNWSHSVPRADNYNVYWIKGDKTVDEILLNGTLIPESEKQGLIPKDDFEDNDTISVVVVAVKEGYEDACSAVAQYVIGSLQFGQAPVLTLTAGSNSIACTWTDSNPAADSYDLYWIEGNLGSAVNVKAGTKITGAASGVEIAGLKNGTVYSVLVTANKSDYAGKDSEIKTAAPNASADEPVTPGRSPKRGISVNGFTANDMALVSPGVSWFYNWGTSWGDYANARTNKLLYMPMFWSGVNASTLRTTKSSYPETEYILGFNEPNLTDQANMTPSAAAQSSRWPALVSIANELNLKIVAPAMNYGTLTNYGDPITWLDEFFGIGSYPGFTGVSIDDIDAMSIHCYMDYPSALKSYIDRFKKYERPIWMTEWCAWENQNGNLANQTVGVKWQIYNMSQSAMYMEQDPMVGRYCWFMLKVGRQGVSNDNNNPTGHNNYPWWALVVNQSNGYLTDLGKVYINMSTCDKNVWYPVGQIIEAKNFSANNLSAITDNGATWRDSVTFRVSTDPQTVSVLDIHDFKNNMWVEYQVEVQQTKAYTLTLRYNTGDALNDTTFRTYIDGVQYGGNISLPVTTGWTTEDIVAITMDAGLHTLRLSVNNVAGNCALNWLKLE